MHSKHSFYKIDNNEEKNYDKKLYLIKVYVISKISFDPSPRVNSQNYHIIKKKKKKSKLCFKNHFLVHRLYSSFFTFFLQDIGHLMNLVREFLMGILSIISEQNIMEREKTNQDKNYKQKSKFITCPALAFFSLLRCLKFFFFFQKYILFFWWLKNIYC